MRAEPGKCPVCSMDLVKATKQGGRLHPLRPSRRQPR
nr:heavy metal-binding domain-containing protein [Hymenobacter qilianensis]